MAKSVLIATLTTAITASGGHAYTDEVRRPSITVVVYDYTSISDTMLQRAKSDVSSIFREAGVEVVWTGPAAENPIAAFAIQILIRRRAAPESVGAALAAMGASLRDSHEAGGLAMLFRDRITHVAHDRNQDVGCLLAYAMAHEMGHLLLPYPAHSSAGIMRGGWDGDDLRHIGDRSLRFSPAEMIVIRAKAADCCGAQRVNVTK
jgi:hypothetical protein